jgi:hypothetical protein
MSGIRLDRRRLIFAGGAAVLVPAVSRADAAIDLEWGDLIPGDRDADVARPRGVIEHGQLATGFEQPASSGLVTAYDGRDVRIPGYAIPLDYSGTGVVAFILAPFVGACVHVPPPPPNQLVLVTTGRPHEFSGLFDPVTVTGTFATAATSTGLAEIGYTLAAERIAPYHR